MDLLQLQDKVQKALPDWDVTCNEAYMLNIEADQIEKHQGFAYIEEFVTWNTTQAGYGGSEEVSRYEITFCKLVDFEIDALQRIAVRQQQIMPAVRKAEKMIMKEDGVTNFQYDVYPRGFDANEVLVHMVFNARERVC